MLQGNESYTRKYTCHTVLLAKYYVFFFLSSQLSMNRYPLTVDRAPLVADRYPLAADRASPAADRGYVSKGSEDHVVHVLG